ncbi:hypothetical protein HK096_009728, partial [Nowakowskiella sp. JEL0078]
MASTLSKSTMHLAWYINNSTNFSAIYAKKSYGPNNQRSKIATPLPLVQKVTQSHQQLPPKHSSDHSLSNSIVSNSESYLSTINSNNTSSAPSVDLSTQNDLNLNNGETEPSDEPDASQQTVPTPNQYNNENSQDFTYKNNDEISVAWNDESNDSYDCRSSTPTTNTNQIGSFYTENSLLRSLSFTETGNFTTPGLRNKQHLANTKITFLQPEASPETLTTISTTSFPILANIPGEGHSRSGSTLNESESSSQDLTLPNTTMEFRVGFPPLPLSVSHDNNPQHFQNETNQQQQQDKQNQNMFQHQQALIYGIAEDLFEDDAQNEDFLTVNKIFEMDQKFDHTQLPLPSSILPQPQTQPPSQMQQASTGCVHQSLLETTSQTTIQKEDTGSCMIEHQQVVEAKAIIDYLFQRNIELEAELAALLKHTTTWGDVLGASVREHRLSNANIVTSATTTTSPRRLSSFPQLHLIQQPMNGQSGANGVGGVDWRGQYEQLVIEFQMLRDELARRDSVDV